MSADWTRPIAPTSAKLTRTIPVTVKYLSPATQTLIVRVSREHLRTLWAALTLLRRVGGAEVIARVRHVSGQSATNWLIHKPVTPS